VEFNRGVGVLTRDGVAIFVMLRPRHLESDDVKIDGAISTGVICIATTHILFTQERGDMKLAQVALLLAELEEFVGVRGRRAPVILCGDFNMAPSSPLHRFVTSGSISYLGMDCEALAKSEASASSTTSSGATIKSELFPASREGTSWRGPFDGALYGLKCVLFPENEFANEQFFEHAPPAVWPTLQGGGGCI
jgi:hypothetical protein